MKEPTLKSGGITEIANSPQRCKKLDTARSIEAVKVTLLKHCFVGKLRDRAMLSVSNRALELGWFCGDWVRFNKARIRTIEGNEKLTCVLQENDVGPGGSNQSTADQRLGRRNDAAEAKVMTIAEYQMVVGSNSVTNLRTLSRRKLSAWLVDLYRYLPVRHQRFQQTTRYYQRLPSL